MICSSNLLLVTIFMVDKSRSSDTISFPFAGNIHSNMALKGESSVEYTFKWFNFMNDRYTITQSHRPQHSK